MALYQIRVDYPPFINSSLSPSFKKLQEAYPTYLDKGVIAADLVLVAAFWLR